MSDTTATRLRAIRGATTIETDTSEDLLVRTAELVETVMAHNKVRVEDIDPQGKVSLVPVGDLPEGEKIPPRVPSDIMDAKTAREVYGDGSFGGRYQAAPEIMHEMFEACLADILQMLKFE